MLQTADATIASLQDLLGERLSRNANLREQHSHGEDPSPPVMPDAVAFVETTEEVGRVLAPVPSERHAGGAVRRGHLAGGSCHAGARRHQPSICRG